MFAHTVDLDESSAVSAAHVTDDHEEVRALVHLDRSDRLERRKEPIRRRRRRHGRLWRRRRRVWRGGVVGRRRWWWWRIARRGASAALRRPPRRWRLLGASHHSPAAPVLRIQSFYVFGVLGKRPPRVPNVRSPPPRPAGPPHRAAPHAQLVACDACARAPLLHALAPPRLRAWHAFPVHTHAFCFPRTRTHARTRTAVPHDTPQSDVPQTPRMCIHHAHIYTNHAHIHQPRAKQYHETESNLRPLCLVTHTGLTTSCWASPAAPRPMS